MKICLVTAKSIRDLHGLPGVLDVAPAKDVYYVSVDDEKCAEFVRSYRRQTGSHRAISFESPYQRWNWWNRLFGLRRFSKIDFDNIADLEHAFEKLARLKILEYIELVHEKGGINNKEVFDFTKQNEYNYVLARRIRAFNHIYTLTYGDRSP